MTKPGRVDTSGEANPIRHQPFAGLDAVAIPWSATAKPPSASSSDAAPPARRSRQEPNRRRGRVDVIRQTAGRGGKTVTVLTGFKGIAERELQELARSIQRACGVGGTLKGLTIEIQGDQRDRACAALEAAGFQPVRAGG
jgi:translation initiation factor 1